MKISAPGYTVEAKELPFNELLGLIGAYLGMALYLKLPLYVSPAFYEKIIETRSKTVIDSAVEDLLGCLRAIEGYDEDEITRLENIRELTVLDRIYMEAHRSIIAHYDRKSSYEALTDIEMVITEEHYEKIEELERFLDRNQQSNAVVKQSTVTDVVEGLIAEERPWQNGLAAKFKKENEGMTHDERQEAEAISASGGSRLVNPGGPSFVKENVQGQFGGTPYKSTRVYAAVVDGVEFVTELALPGITRLHREVDGIDLVGWDKDERLYKFFANVKTERVPIILSAIWRANLVPRFAVANEAFGFNESTLAEWQIDDAVAFFHTCSSVELQRFEAARKEVIKAYPTFKSDVM